MNRRSFIQICSSAVAALALQFTRREEILIEPPPIIEAFANLSGIILERTRWVSEPPAEIFQGVGNIDDDLPIHYPLLRGEKFIKMSPAWERQEDHQGFRIFKVKEQWMHV